VGREAIARRDEDGRDDARQSACPRGGAAAGGAKRPPLGVDEDRYGSLEVGKVVDMVVLADDLRSSDPNRLEASV
jgi:hypothetical protein